MTGSLDHDSERSLSKCDRFESALVEITLGTKRLQLGT